MNRRLAAILGLVVLAGAGVWLWQSRGQREVHYTGFVEGEERVLRSEVSGRVVDVAFAEGEAVPANAVVARIDDADVAARLRTKRQELAVLDAQIARQEQEVAMVELTWKQDLAARGSELRQARAASSSTLTRSPSATLSNSSITSALPSRTQPCEAGSPSAPSWFVPCR